MAAEPADVEIAKDPVDGSASSPSPESDVHVEDDSDSEGLIWYPGLTYRVLTSSRQRRKLYIIGGRHDTCRSKLFKAFHYLEWNRIFKTEASGRPQ